MAEVKVTRSPTKSVAVILPTDGEELVTKFVNVNDVAAAAGGTPSRLTLLGVG